MPVAADDASGGGRAAAKVEPPDEEPDLLGANAACYVCHVTFVKEDLARTHLKAKIGCIKCHGLSEKHANDEHIGATRPDVTFRRQEVDASCLKCHAAHDVPAKAVVARFLGRHLSARTPPVCTDCHGMHKIEFKPSGR